MDKENVRKVMKNRMEGMAFVDAGIIIMPIDKSYEMACKSLSVEKIASAEMQAENLYKIAKEIGREKDIAYLDEMIEDFIKTLD